jgi:hypothetical protein
MLLQLGRQRSFDALSRCGLLLWWLLWWLLRLDCGAKDPGGHGLLLLLEPC